MLLKGRAVAKGLGLVSCHQVCALLGYHLLPLTKCSKCCACLFYSTHLLPTSQLAHLTMRVSFYLKLGANGLNQLKFEHCVFPSLGAK